MVSIKISKADNGYILDEDGGFISFGKNNKPKSYIAKDSKEVGELVKKILG